MALSHLLERGVRLETHEAVALAREFLAHPCGIPSPENIQLGSDGSVVCIKPDGLPSVGNVADLLLTLLPAGTPNVPAPLRYAIARGIEAVEAPPYGSLADFSKALERFEKGASRDVLQGLVRRGARPLRPVAVAPAAAVTPPAVTRPTVAPPRLAAVDMRNPSAPESTPPPPAAAVPPMFRSFGGGEAGSPAHAPRRWPWVAAMALAGSFALGFAVMDGLTEGRHRTPPSGSAPVSPGASARAPEPNQSAANPATVELRDEIVRVPRTEAAAEMPAVEAIRATHANAFSPAFASGGTAIFFHSGRDRDPRSTIEVATADSQAGGELGIMTIVDDGSHNYHPQPSPDGRFVAFDSDRDGERGIYVTKRDGSEVRRVSGPGYAAMPTWSRDNEQLAYIRAEAGKPSVWNLWTQPATGGDARRLTNYRYGQTSAASWFPDNRRIAYSHEDTLLVMDLQTGESTRYHTPVKGQLVRTPAVSPDGTKIIFQVFRHGAWLLEVADGSMQRVLTDPTAEEFAWAPDGRRVAFHSRRDGQWGIFVLLRG